MTVRSGLKYLSLLTILSFGMLLGCAEPAEFTHPVYSQTILVPTPNPNEPLDVQYIQWSPVAGATGYEIWIDISSDFTAPQIFTEIASILTPPITFTINTVYYWRWRAVFASSSGDWSATMAFIPRLIVSP